VTQLQVAGETQGKDAQLALMDGAQNVPLPETPDEAAKELVAEPESGHSKGKKAEASRKPYTWSFLRRDSRDVKRHNQEATATSLSEVAEGLKSADAKPNEDNVVTPKEARKEEEELTIALERLNLAAVNNRVFSISNETQELMQKFNLVLKDLMNGVPTAYDDLESLLTNGDKQLQKTFTHLPGFLQKLIEQLPSQMTKGFMPEIMAAAAARAEKSGINMENAGKAAGAAKKAGFKVPSLKDLVGKPGAVAAMLRSIMTFLRARFPAFMGMNVLWSLAVFVLLFVFWYCHKRGREVRLEKERKLTEKEVEQLEKDYAENPGDIDTTTAPEGATIDEVQAGMIEVAAAREAAANSEMEDDASKAAPLSTLGTTVQPVEHIGS